MLDELLELFERDGRSGAAAQPRRGGIRGLLDRLKSIGVDDDDAPRDRGNAASRRDDDDDDDKDAVRSGAGGRTSRRRDRDGFDFGDD